MGTAAILRDQLRDTHGLFQATVGNLTDEQLHWQPGGAAHSVAASAAHAILGEDVTVNMMLQGKAPLAFSTFAGKTGISEMPPQEFGAWGEWAKTVKVDPAAFHDYAMAVTEASEAWVGGLSDSELAAEVDFTAAGFGKQTVSWAIHNALTSHMTGHTGEISAVKGMQSLQGYPI